jgi:hypothetical protein
LENQPAVGSRPKAPQTGKPRFFPVAQAIEYLLNHSIQPVGRLASCSARLTGHLFRDFRLLHSDFTLATQKRPKPQGLSQCRDNPLFLKDFAN